MVDSDTINRIVEIINEEFENPYPEDIFKHNNKEKMDIRKGRFNEFLFNMVENTKHKIIKIVEDSQSD